MTITATEIARAKEWRRARNLTLDQLSELTGYSVSAIWWFERGQSPPAKGSATPRKVNEFSWQRYKMLCELIDRRMHSHSEWDWS